MPQPTQVSRLVRFGEFALDVRTGELLAANGRKTRLQEQPFQILRALLERPGELLTREELFKRVWPNGTVVDFEHGLNRAVNKLRELLSDSAERPRFIETLPRRGYRWMVAAEWTEPCPADTPVIPPLLADSKTISENLIGKRVSHYRVIELLGGGGMGVVYKAEDIKLGRRVALKFLPEELGTDVVALERFEREARTASALDHPNICTIYGVEEHEGKPVIVMQLLEGQTLRERIGECVPLPLPAVLDIASQITMGLQAAHEKGIIHRDIKPANIFITTRGEAKILDFGLAKLADLAESPGSTAHEDAKGASQNRASLTVTGKAMGTASYMSPEQIRGEELDSRTDLFSFGVVLYEMVAGQQAFPGNSATLVQKAILHNMPRAVRVLNSKIPPKMQEIINRALEKDRGNRFQSASEIRSNLMRLRRDANPA